MELDDQQARQAADALRRLALDEHAKARVAADPALRTVARKIGRRYISGTGLSDAMAHVRAVNAAGHAATVDYMGESTRDRHVADTATEEFLRLVTTIRATRTRASVSLDLSHLGSQIDRELGLTNARRLAEATRDVGVEMLISMEGYDRVQQIIDDHATLCADFDHVGITVQARLHRTATDLPLLLERPGRIRLVKGSYDTPADLAHPRESTSLAAVYDGYTETLLRSGHACSIATHDWDRLQYAHEIVQTHARHGTDYYIEMLQGLGDEQSAEMHRRGHPIQEYVVYGTQEWLYVCNRLAENPQRVLQAIIDATT